MGLKAVVELYHKGVIQLHADISFVLNDALLLILADELLQHDLHGVELPVPQASHKVYFAEASDG
jgi:hypothetical protein